MSIVGLFLPPIGDELTILTALDGVTGQFVNNPVSSAGGMQFYWLVEYNPNDVTLRLVDISVPEPSSLLLAAATWTRRRESKNGATSSALSTR